MTSDNKSYLGMKMALTRDSACKARSGPWVKGY